MLINMRIRHSSSTINKDDFAFIEDIVSNNYVGNGKYVAQLENYLRKYINKNYCFAVNNGSNALFLALKILSNEYAERNEVIVSSYVCTAVLNSIFQADLKPVFVDINAYNLNINIESAVNKINTNTLCVIIASIGGIPIDTSSLHKADVPIIADCSQSIGSSIDGKLSGSEGDLTIFSFGSTKMITGGNGGAILFNNENYFDFIKNKLEYENIPEHYLKNGYSLAYNMKLSDISAGLILSQLNKLSDFINTRQSIAKYYDEFFNNFDNVLLQKEKKGIRFNYYRYYIIWNSSVIDLILHIQRIGIDVSSSLGHNVYRYFSVDRTDFLNCEKLKDRVISLPIYPNIDISQMKKHLNVVKWKR